MQAIQFWTSWPKLYQRIGLILALLFVFSLFFLWYAYVQYPALSWDYIQQLDIEKIPVHTFEKGLLELTVRGDNHFIVEYLLGGAPAFQVAIQYLLLGLLFFCMMISLSIVTLLSRFWYYIGIGVFTLFIVSLRMEILHVFGPDTKLFVALALGLYAVTSFYFHFFKKETAFIIRLLAFSMITATLGAVAIFFSPLQAPLLYLVPKSLLPAILISVMFILTVAHEILASLVYVISQATNQKKSLRHFLIISIMYMINLALLYAHRIGLVEWHLDYLNLFFLLTISGVLGIWGFRQRSPQYSTILPADPFGVFLILCMGTVCFTTIGYLLGTGNDAPLVAIEDIIIYSHIGYGIIFLTYVFSNFIGMMAENMPVYKVLYKPTTMPYFTFRFAGLIATLAFVFYNTWQIPVNNVIAGMYNAEGDTYQALGNSKTADAFYQRASVYGFLNHHSNYAMAYHKGQQYDFVQEQNFYNRSTQRRPTEFSYVNLSYTFQRQQEWLSALLSLNDARKAFPDSGPIANMLGMLYSKLDVLDSSLYFLKAAMPDASTKNTAKINFLRVFANTQSPLPADSLLALIGSGDEAVKSNVIALANAQGNRATMNMELNKSLPLDLFSASHINNYVINRMRGEEPVHWIDTAFIDEVVTLARDSLNRSFREPLLFTSALAFYEQGRVWDAFILLEEVASFSEQRGRYNSILALWSLEQDSPQRALTFLDYALKEDYPEIEVASAVALLESGQRDKALTWWSRWQDQDSTYQPLAQNMVQSLTALPAQFEGLTDHGKYLYCYYRIDLLDSAQFNLAVAQIGDQDLQARLFFETSKKLFEIDQTRRAISTLQHINGLPMTDQDLYRRISDFELDLLAKQKNIAALAERLQNTDTKEEVTLPLRARQLYYDALLSEWRGDSLKAHAQYTTLSKRNPYHEEGIIAAAHYFSQWGKDDLRPYTILVDALQYNPYSVKLLKAYSLEATKMGLDEYAINALERLQLLVGQEAMTLFLSKHQPLFAAILTKK